MPGSGHDPGRAVLSTGGRVRSSARRGAGSAWRPAGVGQVLQRRAGRGRSAAMRRQRLAAGDEVFAEDILRTGPDSRAADRLQRRAADRRSAPAPSLPCAASDRRRSGGAWRPARPAAGDRAPDRRLVAGAAHDRDRHPHRRGVGPLHRVAGRERRTRAPACCRWRARSPCSALAGGARRAAPGRGYRRRARRPAAKRRRSGVAARRQDAIARTTI